MHRQWMHKAVAALAVLGLVLGAGAWWAESRQANLAYLFRPLTVELDGVLASEDDAIAIRLEQMTLTGTELRLTGLFEREGFEDWQTRHLRVSLINLTRPDRYQHRDTPLSHRFGSAPAKFEFRYGPDGKLRAEWRFPYTALDAEPGDELAFVLNGYTLQKITDRGESVKIADLAPDRLPADLRVGEDGIFRIKSVDWRGERGETRITAEHLPGPALEGLAEGYHVTISVPMIRDQRGEQYRSVGGSGRGGPDQPWAMESSFLPIDPAQAEELSFLFYSVSLSWDAYTDQVPHTLIALPRGRH